MVEGSRFDWSPIGVHTLQAPIQQCCHLCCVLFSSLTNQSTEQRTLIENAPSLSKQMGQSESKTQVHVHIDKPYYYAGDVVTGFVVLHAGSVLDFKSINIKVRACTASAPAFIRHILRTETACSDSGPLLTEPSACFVYSITHLFVPVWQNGPLGFRKLKQDACSAACCVCYARVLIDDQSTNLQTCLVYGMSHSSCPVSSIARQLTG